MLRNVFGIPLWVLGYLWAWLIPTPWIFKPSPIPVALGWIFVIVGSVPVLLGHADVGMRSHLPSVRDTLVSRGLYAYVRHPIYAGVLIIMPGLALIQPSLAVLVASALGFVWLFVQARLEELDLLQRMLEYWYYMRLGRGKKR